mmetsp:Transcript_9358/g.17759  ORF Transcript_9358/g.17759 Transcript_9358/m.17759 type:complete len:296 (+) Transcript_9358:67-954(+)
MGCNSSKTNRVAPPCGLGELCVGAAESCKATVVMPLDVDKASIVQPESEDQDASKKEGKLGETAEEGAPSKENVLSQLKTLFDANAQQDQTVKRTQLVNALEKRSLLLGLIEEAGLTVDLLILKEPGTNGNENISWGAFEKHLKGTKVDQEQRKSSVQPTTTAVALTPEEIKVAETAAAKRLEGVFGKMGVKQQAEDDHSLPAVGDTQEIVTMLRDDRELVELIAEAGLSSFCFALERLGDKGVDSELLLQELEGILAARGGVPGQASEAALIRPAEPQPLCGALWCQTGQSSQP